MALLTDQVVVLAGPKCGSQLWSKANCKVGLVNGNASFSLKSFFVEFFLLVWVKRKSNLLEMQNCPPTLPDYNTLVDVEENTEDSEWWVYHKGARKERGGLFKMLRNICL